MRNKTDLFLLAFPITGGLTALIIIILMIVGVDPKISLSFGLGSMTTLMMMSLLQKSVNKVLLLDDQTQAKKQTVMNYVFRYFFYAFILVTAAIHPNLRVEYVALGLIIFKLVLYILLLFINRKDVEQHD